MIDRRRFLTGAGRAAAGAAMLGGSFGALAQGRKEVYVGSTRATVVDIHAHCLFQEVAPIIVGTEMANADLGDFLTLGPQRIDEMDARGIDIAALSVNRFWWYVADEARARDIVRINDEGLAAWCEDHPDRFVALCSPSMQHPEMAAEQLDYAVNELDHRGASVLGHVNGVVPSGPEYDVFWAKAQELDVPVFMHPDNARNLIQPGQLDGIGGLNNIVGNPLETAVFLTRMILEGTLDRFPNLIIVGAHGGGYLPSYLGRTEVACARNGANCVNEKNPSEYLKDQILVDTMVFSEEALRHLVAEVGTSQVVYGSDMPFAWPDTVDLVVDSPHLSDDEKLAILGGNLMRLLRIESV